MPGFKLNLLVLTNYGIVKLNVKILLGILHICIPFMFHMDSIDFLLIHFGYVVFYVKGLNFNSQICQSSCILGFNDIRKDLCQDYKNDNLRFFKG